jgi:hypothetical protein
MLIKIAHGFSRLTERLHITQHKNIEQNYKYYEDNDTT